MALKKKANSVDTRQELRDKIHCIDADIIRLQEQKIVLQKELLEIDIKPFKIGDYALVKIPSGRNVKEQKCLLECESGILYVRPIKENGELSGRHFSVVPVAGHKYSEYLKEVK